MKDEEPHAYAANLLKQKVEFSSNDEILGKTWPLMESTGLVMRARISVERVKREYPLL